MAIEHKREINGMPIIRYSTPSAAKRQNKRSYDNDQFLILIRIIESTGYY